MDPIFDETIDLGKNDKKLEYLTNIDSVISELFNRMPIEIFQKIEGTEYCAPLLESNIDHESEHFFDVKLISEERKEIVLKLRLDDLYIVGILIRGIWYLFTDSRIKFENLKEFEKSNKCGSFGFSGSYPAIYKPMNFTRGVLNKWINSLDANPLDPRNREGIQYFIVAISEAIRIPSIRTLVSKSFDEIGVQSNLDDTQNYHIQNWESCSENIVIMAATSLRDRSSDLNKTEPLVCCGKILNLKDFSVLKIKPNRWENSGISVLREKKKKKGKGFEQMSVYGELDREKGTITGADSIANSSWRLKKLAKPAN